MNEVRDGDGRGRKRSCKSINGSMKKRSSFLSPSQERQKGNQEKKKKDTAEFAAACHLGRKESDTKWGWKKKDLLLASGQHGHPWRRLFA